MKHYNPLRSPDPKEWLALDEAERIDLVRKYHRQKSIRLPNLTAHALFHVIIENQLALRNSIPVEHTLQRLLSEGLDRHEAIYAIGSVLAIIAMRKVKPCVA